MQFAAAGDRRTLAGDRRRDLHLHERRAACSRRSAHERDAVSAAASRRAQDLTPRAIVEELDRYIVGQKAAKRAVAVALRNRWRRQQVPPPSCATRSRPRTSCMIGPTGVGQDRDRAPAGAARAARRSSRSRRRSSPRSATSAATSTRWSATWSRPRCRCCARRSASSVRPRARENAEERLLDVLLPPAPRQRPTGPRT